MPIDSWPLFGGWKLLDPSAEVRVPTSVEPDDAEHEGDDRDSDDEDDVEVEVFLRRLAGWCLAVKEYGAILVWVTPVNVKLSL